MAAVVGNLAYQSLGEYTGVIAEPIVLATAAQEFSNLEAIVNTVTNYVQTPYIWGNYTIIVMPPSFPEGGTPNPLLCYTSITTITGDKSQEYVLVRTAAAMYTAAQVTPNNWEDYWLNEGITTFIERHVQAQLWDATFAATSAYVGNNSLSTATFIIGA
jgi:aminopeptidase N